MLREENILVCVNTAAVLLRQRADLVYEMADGGTLLEGSLTWVFDLSARGSAGVNRDLRFFLGELLAPATARNLTLPRVLDCILPPAVANFQSGRVERLLGLRKQSIMRLRDQMGGQRSFNTTYFPRQKLAEFLASRWLGRGLTGPQNPEGNGHE
jgi:hypothetical protein